MRELEPDACAEYLSFVRATIRTNNRLLESSPLPHDNEVTLLAVDRDVHGLCVGSVLLDAAVSYLSSRGATRAHLYTDSNCSWKSTNCTALSARPRTAPTAKSAVTTCRAKASSTNST